MCTWYVYDDSHHASTSVGVQTNTSLEPDPTRVLSSLGQGSSPAAPQQQLTRGLEVGRTATEVDGRRRTPYEAQHGTGACTAAAAAAAAAKKAAKKARDRRLVVDPFVSHRGSTVVLPPAESKEPLTLVRPCVRCCFALWAWRCSTARFVQEAKAPRSG